MFRCVFYLDFGKNIGNLYYEPRYHDEQSHFLKILLLILLTAYFPVDLNFFHINF